MNKLIGFTCFALASTTPFSVVANPKKKTQSGRTEAWSPEKQATTFTLQDGFVIELVASEEHGLINPIDLTFDDAGRLWTQTAEMYPLDPIPNIRFGDAKRMMMDHSIAKKDERFAKIHRLYTLEERGKDKILIIDKPTEQAKGPLTVWADGLAIPQSIMPYKDGCYVAHGSELFFLDDRNKDGKQDAVDPVLSGFGFIDTHTMAHSIVRGPGGWMHFSHGAVNSGTVEVVKSGQELNITYSKNARFSVDGQELEVINCHRDNNWGYQVLSNGQWYATSANDNGYSVLPSEPMSSIPGNGDDKIRPYSPFFPGVHEFRVGGTGISGLAFSEDGAHGFPSEFENVAILANPITGTLNCVRIVRQADGSVKAEHLKDLLSCTDDWFRPVNIEFGPDGCLYIADWYNKIVSHNEVSRAHPDRDRKHGRIWRVRHQSQKPFAIPNVAKAANKDLLVHLLEGKTIWEKRAAWHQIVDRQATELAPKLKELILDTSVPKDSRILALWSFEGLRQFDKALLQSAIADSDLDLRREAIRSLATFGPSAAEVAQLVAPYIDDENCMVRSQILRTLDEIKVANHDTIDLLVQAAKPAAVNNDLGGNYERNFERFLVRKALERYKAELLDFLQTDRAKTHPASNILWAIQALPENDRVTLFVENWREASKGTIDKNTLISVSRMLDKPLVRKAVAPTFAERPEEMLQLAVENHEQVNGPQVATFYREKIEALLNSDNPQEVSEGLRLINKLRSPHHTNSLTRLLFDDPGSTRSAGLFSALSHDGGIDPDVYQKVFANTAFSKDLRISALAALAIRNEKAAKKQAANFAADLNAEEKRRFVTLFSHTLQGNNILKHLWQEKILPTNAWDYNAAFRTRDGNMSAWSSSEITKDPWDGNKARKAKAAYAKDGKGAAIHAAALKVEKAAREKREQQVKTFIAASERLEGDPAVGKALFMTCLTCHQVGGEGQGLAPPLDGGKERVTEHLITAIVNPDEAVEGAYGLYSVVRRDGSFLEGYLIKADDAGTKIGVPGGTTLFVARENILYQGGVNSRSFMPNSFGELSEQAMIDLVTYIQTIE